VSERSLVPIVALGAAGAVAIVTLLRPRAAIAAPTSPSPSSTPRKLFQLGRPIPTSVHAVVSSGWLESRGERLHRALDILAPTGTPIHAIDDGVVTRVVTVDQGDAGRWVAVKHASGLTSRYLHLSRTSVLLGQAVRRGDLVGLCGETGDAAVPHLHLDLRVPSTMLPDVERAIGKPRPGWGPELKPFGISIPGEPWIPVDAYQRAVRRDAEEAGIPLYDATVPRNGTMTYRAVGGRGEPYPAWLRAMRGQSGVYVIRERDRVGDPVIVYVGESSTGRLYETLTRHFQNWRRYKGFWRGQYAVGHDPGLTYDRASVEVAIKVTPPSKAIDEEARLIRRLRPRDNLLGQPELEEAPF
jgi:hypothetical protein